MEPSVCNLCGNHRSVVVLAGRDDAKFLGSYRPSHKPPQHDLFRLVRCANCGLIYAWPRPRSDDLTAYYASYQDDVYESEQEGRREIARRQLRWLAESGGFDRNGARGPLVGKRVLEIGAATGIFLAEARALGCDVVGIEPSAWARSVAREKHGLELRDGDVAAQRFPEAHFDVVCLFDVIEHLDDPRATMAEVARIVAPGGHVVVLTPDMGHWRARVMGTRWWGLQQSHLYYFERSTLLKLITSLKLEVVRIDAGCRVFTLQYWAKQLRGYNRVAGALASALCIGSMGKRKFTVSFPDHMLVLARKAGAADV